jgi:hypothetical protein
MGLGQKFLGGPHGHADDGSGGHITRPRRYEYVAAIGFLGQRRRVYATGCSTSVAAPAT